MTDREKLIDLIYEGKRKRADICSDCEDCSLCERDADGDNCGDGIIADHLLANGVTMKERLIEKLVVINKKYGSIRCPSCNAILGASYHYCWQCGQKIIHKLPQSPKEGE